MNTIFSFTLLCGVLALTSLNTAGAGEPVPYPEGYRNWTHVKSMLIEPGHALANPFQGIHHVYANPAAIKGLKNGRYSDGSVLVFDLLNYSASEHTIQEGARKLVGVMVKNATQYGDTGGWGFEGFAGDSQVKRLTTDGGASCFGCHAPQKGSDYVFSTYRD